MKYQCKIFMSAIKHFLLYRVPNLVLLYFFRDRNGVYAIYESIKYRNGIISVKYCISVLKVMISLLGAAVLFPFAIVIYAINILLIGKIYLPRVEIVLTTFCSLKCRDCSNPYHIDADSIIQVLQNLTASIDSLTQLVLLGGEPFIYPDFVKILNYTNSNPKIKSICIKTNGVFKMSDEILQVLKCAKVHLDVSDYGVRSDMVGNNCRRFRKEKIAYFCQDRKPWYDMGDMTRRKRTVSELTMQYKNCNYKCRCILNGKLYICPRASHGSDLGFFKEQLYVDLLTASGDAEEVRNKILSLYYYDKPMQACDWCDAGTDKCVPIPCGVQVDNRVNRG